MPNDGRETGWLRNFAEQAGRELPGVMTPPAQVIDSMGNGLQWLEKKLTGETDEQYAARLAQRKQNAPLAGTRFAPQGAPDIVSQLANWGGKATQAKRLLDEGRIPQEEHDRMMQEVEAEQRQYAPWLRFLGR